MSQEKRQRKKARSSSPTRQTKKLILIIHEGKNTEPDYLNGLKQACKNKGVHLRVIKSDGSPENYVNKAIQMKDKCQENLDEIWCVFDEDHHNVQQLNRANIIAGDNNIKLAVSVPCIEVWLYLHFKDDPGYGSAAIIKKKLEKILPDYDKSVNFVKHYKNGYFDAVQRSKIRLRSAENDNDLWRNPTTRMHLLCESIRGDSNV
jgi:hypothetical protein